MERVEGAMGADNDLQQHVAKEPLQVIPCSMLGEMSFSSMSLYRFQMIAHRPRRVRPGAIFADTPALEWYFPL